MRISELVRKLRLGVRAVTAVSVPIVFMTSCGLSSGEGTGADSHRQSESAPWRAKISGDVLSKAFYPMEGMALEDYELQYAETPIEVFGLNEWWAMTSRHADVFVPRTMIKDLEGPDLGVGPAPMFSTLSRADHAPCPIQTVDANGRFVVIGSLPPDHPVGVYSVAPTYTQISPWLHWVSSSCLVNASSDNPQELQRQITGFMRSFRKSDGSWNGSVICYENGNRVYLGYRETGATSATVPYGGPRDGSECYWGEEPLRWEGPRPSRRLCATLNGCRDATQSDVPFHNLAEMILLQSLLSISGQPIQDIEFGPTGGGRFIVGFLGATGEQINAAAHSQSVDMVFALTAYMAAVNAGASNVANTGAVIPLATAVPAAANLAALPDDAIVGMAGRPDLRLALRPQDHLPIGEVTTPGKSASVLNSFQLEELLKRFFGPNRLAEARDAIYGAFVGDIRAAGFDVVPAPTLNNPSHVRIIPKAPGASFDSPTFLERLLAQFTIVSKFGWSN